MTIIVFNMVIMNMMMLIYDYTVNNDDDDDISYQRRDVKVWNHCDKDRRLLFIELNANLRCSRSLHC